VEECKLLNSTILQGPTRSSSPALDSSARKGPCLGGDHAGCGNDADLLGAARAPSARGWAGGAGRVDKLVEVGRVDTLAEVDRAEAGRTGEEARPLLLPLLLLPPHAGAYTRPLLSSASVVCDTKCTLETP
jgi:hypothetical protein